MILGGILLAMNTVRTPRALRQFRLNKKLFINIAAVFVLFAIAATSILANENLRKRLGSMLKVQAISSSNRLQDWNLTMHMIADKPITGHGLVTRHYFFTQYQKEKNLQALKDYHKIISHNVILGIGADMGLLAMGLFVFILLAHFNLNGGGFFKGPSVLRKWHLALILAMAGFFPSLMVGAFVDTSAILFWLIIGLGMRVKRPKVVSIPQQTPKAYLGSLRSKLLAPATSWGLLFLMGISAVFGVLRYVSRYYYDLGSGYKAAGKTDLAEEMLLKAAFLLPGNYYYPLELARVNVLQQDFTSARKYYDEVLNILPFDVSQVAEYGNQLYAMGFKNEGKLVLEKALSLAAIDSDGNIIPNLIFDQRVGDAQKSDYFAELLKGNVSTFFQMADSSLTNRTVAEKIMAQSDPASFDEVQVYQFVRLSGLLGKDHLLDRPITDRFYELFPKYVWQNIARERSLGNLNRSNTLVNTYLRRQHKDAVFLNEMAINLFVEKRMDEAAIVFLAAIQNWDNLYVENLIAHEYLSEIYENSHRHSKAQKHRFAADFIKRDLATKVALSLGSWFDPQALQIKEYMDWL
jgi:tetratricopeptide (TPR) repeat protein